MDEFEMYITFLLLKKFQIIVLCFAVLYASVS